MSSNIVTEIIDILGKFEVSETKLAWQSKQLMDKLYLVEQIYEELSCHNMGLSVQECDRYTQEVFPSLLVQCRKLDKYFNLCPGSRQTEQNMDILRIQFLRYSKILDRLLVKLQKSQEPILGKMIRWLAEFKESVFSICASITHSVKRIACQYSVALPRLFIGRKTMVIYHRDTLDYEGNGHNLRPIQVLTLDGF